MSSASRLLVGGSDGSGTRSVVKLLQQLGTHMVIDDMGTYDVHGQEMVGGKGWPDVVRPVLDEVHNADYEFGSLSDGTKAFVRAELGKMNAAHERKKRPSAAGGVDYGIKAPVSMLLVPGFREIWGQMRFIHVVRDGRDIAFSGNQSPVNKFYRNSYADGEAQYQRWEGRLDKVRPMQLWSDWNADLLDWERRNADGETFDFLVLRLEDLLDPEERYAQMARVADFVGSPKTREQICCLSREGVKDMGSHTHGNKPSDVTKRYGKWHDPLSRDPELSEALHREGRKGLDAFG
ncbi:hypothetical protein TeGR_g238, partial [Tetraparma gracilis]